MPEQGGDSRLGKTNVVGDAGECMPQAVRRQPDQHRLQATDARPSALEATVAAGIAGEGREHEEASGAGVSPLEDFERGTADRPGASAGFRVAESKARASKVAFRPLEIQDFPDPAPR